MEIGPMNMQVLDARRDATGGYKVDVSRGERIGRVSSEWFSRPADERYLSLSELARTRCATAPTAAGPAWWRARSSMWRRTATMPERLALILPGTDTPSRRPHWCFGQLASLVGAPAAYLRQLPAALAGINLQYGLTSNRAEQIKTLETDDGRVELRAVTGPDYGRIFDHELVEAVQRIAGNGTGDTRWKVPGVLDWSTGIYNPRVDITKDTTTLYASDRDVFLFLVDDLQSDRGRPAAGRLAGPLFPRLLLLEFRGRRQDARHGELLSPRGLPEPQFAGAWRISRRSPSATPNTPPIRFAHEAAPALLNFANSSPAALRQRHQGRARADRRQNRRGPHRVPAPARLLQGRDRQDHRDGAGRGRPPAREHLRLRPGHHRRRARQAPSGRAPRHGGQGQEAARSSRLISAKPGMRISVSPALRFRVFPVRSVRGAAPFRGRGRRFAS